MNREERPRLDVPKILRGSGELRHEGGVFPVPVFELRGSDYDASIGWAFTIHFDGPAGAHFLDLPLLPDKLVLGGETDRGRKLRLPTVPWQHYGPGLLTGTAHRVELDVEPLASEPAGQFLYARLSPTPLALPVVESAIRSWTGEITSEGQRDPCYIRTDLGRLEFYLAYDYEDLSFEGGQGLARLPVPRLSLEVDPGERTKDVAALLTRFQEICEGVTAFLSFLSRRRVIWMSLHHSARWKEPSPGFLDSTVYRHGVDTPTPQLVGQLMNGYHLSGDALSESYERWRDLPYHESVRKASSFLHQCFLSSYVEDRALGAFMALETLTDGFSKHAGILDLVDDAGLRQLRERLQPVVKECAKELGVDSAGRKGLYAKLGELKMAPLVPRVVELVTAASVEWSDLWPEGTSLEDALRVAYERRSDLVHAGKTDREGLFRDIIRLHALAERIICSLCETSDQWLDVAAYSHLRYVSDRGL